MFRGSKPQRLNRKSESQPDNWTFVGPWHSVKRFMLSKRFVYVFVVLATISLFLVGVMPVTAANDSSPPDPSRNSVIMTNDEEEENSSYRVEQIEDVSDSVNDDSGTGAQNDDQSSGENSNSSDSEEVTDTPKEPSDTPPSEDDADDGALQEDEDKEQLDTESNEETDDQKSSADEKQQEPEESETDAGDGEIEESSDHRWYAGTDVGTITINNGGSRSDGGTVSGLDGSIFVAVKSNTPMPPDPPTSYKDFYYCTTGGASTSATGSCKIQVPLNEYYWIFQYSTADNWEKVEFVGTNRTADMKSSTYAFRVIVEDEETPVTLTRKDSLPHVTSDHSDVQGQWINVRTNPNFPQQCIQDEPLRIALVFDQSSTIDSEEQLQLKSAATSFISKESLGGTKTEVGLYKFTATASIMLDATSISDDAGIATVTNSINEMLTPGSGQATNWDAALRLVAKKNWDAVLFLTDGSPTRSGATGELGNGLDVSFMHVENAAFSANALKVSGTAVFSVGIGVNSDGAIANLKAIADSDDVYLAKDFEKLQHTLHSIAQRAQCQASVNVYKQVTDKQVTNEDDEDGDGVAPYVGWPMNVALESESDPTAISLEGKEKQETGLAGFASWSIKYVQPQGLDTSVVVSEDSIEGYKFVSVSYTIVHADGTSDTVGPITDQPELTFKEIKPGDAITVFYVNEAPPPVEVKGSVQWSKVDDHDKSVHGTEWKIINKGTQDEYTVMDNTGVEYSGLDKDPAGGKFLVEELPAGTYALVETDTPAGYVLNETEYEFAITENNPDHIFATSFINVRKTGTVTWTKVDEEGNPLSGSVWEITDGETTLRVEDNTGQEGYTGIDKDETSGSFKVEGLTWGKYELVEVTAPSGYVLNATSHTFTISADALNYEAGEFINYPIIVPTLPLTGGTSSSSFFIAGGIILLITAAAIIVSLRRRQMMRKRADADIMAVSGSMENQSVSYTGANERK